MEDLKQQYPKDAGEESPFHVQKPYNVPVLVPVLGQDIVKVTRTEPIVKHTHHQAVATTDDDDVDKVASSLDRGSIGTLDQIDVLMRKASRETPTTPADETGSTLGEILAIARSQQPDECDGTAVCVDDDSGDSKGINYLIFYKVLNIYS